MKLSLTKKSFSRTYDDAAVAEAGKQDGSMQPPIPAWDAPDLPPSARQLTQVGSASLQDVEQQWVAEDRSLKPRWETAEDRLSAAEAEKETADQARKDKEAVFESDRNCKAPPTDFRYTLYHFVMVVLGILDTPLNMVVFRCFGESEALTGVLASGLAAIMIMLAHFLGKSLAEGKRIAAASLAFAALGLMLSVAYVRSLYLAARSAAPDDGSTVRLDQGPMMIVIFLISLALFVAACIYARDIHDDLLRAVFKARRQFDRACRRLASVSRLRDAAVSERKKRHAHYYAEAAGIVQTVSRKIDVYRAANLRARTDRGEHPGEPYPRCYAVYGQLHMPAELQALSWERGVPATRLASGAPAVSSLEGASIVTAHPDQGGDLPRRIAAGPGDPSSQNGHRNNLYQNNNHEKEGHRL